MYMPFQDNGKWLFEEAQALPSAGIIKKP